MTRVEAKNRIDQMQGEAHSSMARILIDEIYDDFCVMREKECGEEFSISTKELTEILECLKKSMLK